MADHTQADQPGEGMAGAGGPGPVEGGLNELRKQLGRLQQSVELLGTQGFYAGDKPPPAEHAAAPAPPGPPPGATEYSYGTPDPGAPGPAQPVELPRYDSANPVDPPFAAPEPAYSGDPYAAAYPPPVAPPPPATWEQPFDPPPTGPPPPVATNGHAADPAEISARSSTVAIVDAGPFEDLIELRHFEDDLTTLGAVRDVRVRRFGHGRANIEVGMTGPYAIGRELYRLGRAMEVSDGPLGEIVIELAPPPEEPVADPAASAPADHAPLEYRQGPA